MTQTPENQNPENPDYEHPPKAGPLDDTAVNLRAYLADRSDEHLAGYDRTWTDDQVVEWDGNFRNDGSLMLVCCHRDVDIAEFREALHEHLELRGLS